MNLGLIGNKLSHSFSPGFFNQKFNELQLQGYSYKTFELEHINPAIIHELVSVHQLSGFNVTIPYKTSIIPALHGIDPIARQIGAVNTVKVIPVQKTSTKDFQLIGFNTDWSGFLKSIRPFLTSEHHQALILGTGGASKAVAYGLQSLGIQVWFASQSVKNQPRVMKYSDINPLMIQHIKLIVNATPLGMYPNIDSTPEIPYHSLSPEHLLVDLVYNPAETNFLKQGKSYGAATLSGLSMLTFQADDAWEIWHQQ